MLDLYPSFTVALLQVLRRLAKAPLFSVITLLTLTIAIGANTVIFSVVDGIVLKPLNYPHSDRLISLRERAPGIDLADLPSAQFLYFTLREQNTTFDDIAAYNYDSISVTGTGEPEHLQGLDVTDGALPLLGAKPTLGRLFKRYDDSPSAPKTVILSYAYWQRRFGGSSAVLGRTLVTDGVPREVVGVLPRGFDFLDSSDADLFLPMQWDRSKVMLGDFGPQAFGRLKAGVTINQARADFAHLIPIALHTFPAPGGYGLETFEKAQIQPNLSTLKRAVIGDVGNTLWVLMGSILVVLLVACANVANLLLVRVEGRRQEFAIRSALGASRARIALDLLFESLVLGLAGGLAGLTVAYGALRVLVAIAPTGLPRLREIGIYFPVLLFTLGLSLLVSLVIAAIPMLKLSGARATTGLREGGRALSQSRERHRARKTLVVVQVALALVLLICSGLMIRTFRSLVNVSPGFSDPASLAAFGIDIPDTQIPGTQNERVLRVEQAIANKLAALPGVSAVGITTGVPLTNSYTFNPIQSEDRTYRPGQLGPMRRRKWVGPGYFATIGTPLVAGRDFTWAEEYQKRPVAIISENFAREYWGSPAAAIGKRIRETAPQDWREIVGVVGDVYDDGVDQPAPTTVYWPLFQNNFSGQKESIRRDVSFVVRSPRAGSAAFVTEMQRAVWSIDPELPLSDVTTLGVLYAKSIARTSFVLVMLGVAGSMALLLSTVGIYGVISYAVSQCTREIGIRMALGAQREEMTGLFVRQGLWLTGIGIGCGLAIALAGMRWMASLLFGVSPMDPWTYAAAGAIIAAIAGLACYVPSRRAAKVDPVSALRAE
jgi:predicted permease